MCANSPISFHHADEPNSCRWPAFQQSEDGGDINGNASIDRKELGGNSLMRPQLTRLATEVDGGIGIIFPEPGIAAAASVADTTYTANRPRKPWLYGSTIRDRLGFLEAFRTFCLAPPAELRALAKEVGMRGSAVVQP